MAAVRVGCDYDEFVYVVLLFFGGINDGFERKV